MRVRFTAFLFGLAAVLCLGLMGGYAEEKTTYSVGDSVKVKYVGEVVTGTITSTKISGSIEVEFKWKGKTLSKSFPLTLVEGPGDEPAKPAPVTKPAGTPAKPAAPPKKPAADKPAMKSGTGQRPAPALKPENQPEAKPEATSTNKQEMRTWTDDTGKFTVEASFDGLEDGEVKLLKPDGKTTRIPLDKLSPADRELAEQLAEKQAAKPAPKPGDKNSPFKNSEDSSETAGAGQHEMRTWTSANGKSTFEARYAGYELGVVTLIKADGKKVKLSIHKLQQADQLVAMQLSNEEWHKNQTLSGEMSPKRDPGVPSDQLAGTVQASSQNWVGVRTMPSSAELPVEFHLEPDIAVEKKLEVMEGPFIYASRKAPKAGAQIEFGTRDEVTRLMIDPESNQAIVVLRSQLGAETPVIRVVRIDLKDGKVAAQPFQFATDLRAYHPTTHRCLGNTSWDVNPHDSSLKQHLFGVWTQGEKAFEQLGALALRTRSQTFFQRPGDSTLCGIGLRCSVVRRQNSEGLEHRGSVPSICLQDIRVPRSTPDSQSQWKVSGADWRGRADSCHRSGEWKIAGQTAREGSEQVRLRSPREVLRRSIH